MKRSAILFLLLVPSCNPAPEPPPRIHLNDYKGAIHVHSRYSHDSKGAYEEILSAAKKVGLDFVIMTDHPPKDDPGLPLREGWRGVYDNVLFIQGAELSSQILALGIKEPVTVQGRQAKIDAIHAQGGLAFICHGEEVEDWDFTGFDGMEIYNIHTALKQKSKDLRFMAKVIKQYRTDPDGAWLHLCEPQKVLLKRWDELSKTRRVVGIAGNDAHQNTLGLDPYWRSLGFVNTHVLAPELTEGAILDAIRRGNCYVSFDVLGDPRMGYRIAPFEVRRDSLIVTRDSESKVSFESLTFRNGSLFDLDWKHKAARAGPPHIATIAELREPGTYRLEFRMDKGGKTYPWIYSNQVQRTEP